ncbi:MAG: PEP-CTERM sorting domain-containing protein [Planctomycetota bacterium]
MRSLLALFFFTACTCNLHAAEVDSFDDIELWTGTGSNEAAIVIDFIGESTADRSYVWGYRWDGDQTIEDMLLAVVQSDSRLFANVDDGSSLFGRTVYGIGYDTNNNRVFGIENPATNFNEFGLAISDNVTEGISATDAGDDYEEGFSLGFWNLGNSVGNPFDGGSWAGSPVGISGIITGSDFLPTGEIKTMSDGEWASLAWNNGDDGFATVFASNPFAAAVAVPEPGGIILLVALGGVVACRRRR